MSDSVKKYYENLEKYSIPSNTKDVNENWIDFERRNWAMMARNMRIMMGLPEDKDINEQCKVDEAVEFIKKEFDYRSHKGIKKYGTTLTENKLSLLEWLQHAKEEAMDQVLYLQRAIDEIRSEEDNTTKKV